MLDKNSGRHTSIHIVTSSADEKRGGMEAAVLRVAEYLSLMSDTLVTVYASQDSEKVIHRQEKAYRVFNLADLKSKIIDPLSCAGSIGRRADELMRVDYLIFRNAVADQISKQPKSGHLLLSFFASTSGFIAQHVAQELRIPHIASVRGTDFSRDFRGPRLALFEFVIRNASWIVTTNLEQEAAIRRLLGGKPRISTIHNGVEIPAEKWCHHARTPVRLVADCGYSFKKGTHLLINCIAELCHEGLPITLKLVGNCEESETQYWDQLRSRFAAKLPDVFEFETFCDHSRIKNLLIDGDIYCSASLGEGCSNASLLALALGIPMVATKTGALPELAAGIDHVMLCPPGDPESFKSSLRSMALQLLSGAPKIDDACIGRLRANLATAHEQAQWHHVVRSVRANERHRSSRVKPRVLFFAHDGTGLGHLRRTAKVAQVLSDSCSCLFVTGHREASWIVPPTCDYIHLPAFDLPTMDHPATVTRFSEDVGFLDCGRLRRGLIEKTVEEFSPDAIVVDYLPIGKFDELLDVLERSVARKYLILRGILDRPQAIRPSILGGKAELIIEGRYDRILVTCDRRICDVVAEYAFPPTIAAKTEHVGYVSEPVSERDIIWTRTEWRISDSTKWVVCSAGGGALGERLVTECYRLASTLHHVQFDIVMGPKSRCSLRSEVFDSTNSNVRLHREVKQLSMLHAAADVVVCPAGYNTLLEALEGRAQIICMPTQIADHLEQSLHARRLAAFGPISIVNEFYELRTSLESALTNPNVKPRIREVLDLEGLTRIRDIICKDLAISSTKNAERCVSRNG